jgi:hypothetical protein
MAPTRLPHSRGRQPSARNAMTPSPPPPWLHDPVVKINCIRAIYGAEDGLNCTRVVLLKTMAPAVVGNVNGGPAAELDLR